VNAAALPDRIAAIDAVLPQTQCTRCGYPDCRSYAQAIAEGEAAINQCPPGGAEGVQRLASLTGQPIAPLDPVHGVEGPRRLAVIDETWCIGCTLCLDACPVDSILGGPKRMHTVIDALCTGCELCIPVCPVDCISLVDATGDRTGWQAWSSPQADEARERYGFHRFRIERDERERIGRLAARTASPALQAETAAVKPANPQDVIAAALARARARKPV
jgi:electron transport complex protein RnfB